MPSNCKCGKPIKYPTKSLCGGCYLKQLKIDNPEFAQRQREGVKKWKASNPDKVKITARKTYHNIGKYTRRKITKEWFEAQPQECSICKSVLDLVIDHNHSTDKVRGLLCWSCNVGLGHLKDSPELLRQAALYIEVHRAQ